MKWFCRVTVGALYSSILITIQGCTSEDIFKLFLILLALYLPGGGDGEESATDAFASIFFDDFESGTLNGWTHDILVTWQTGSFSHGIVDDNGNGVTFIKGGVDNGGGGGQTLFRSDISTSGTTVKTKIRFIENPNHVNVFSDVSANAGLLTRYTSIGKGYGTYISYQINTGTNKLILHRMDGTVPGSNFAYSTASTVLAGPHTLNAFDPTQWHTLELITNGSQISVAIDGQVLLQATDNTYSDGNPGLLFWGSDGGGWALYDDFEVIS